MCKMITINPITFSCECFACNVHLSNHFVKDGKIKCPECNEEFKVMYKGEFKAPNKIFKNTINKELYLSEHEREAKKSFHSFLDQFEQKYEILIAEAQSYETENYDHFAELRRQMDLQKEVLIRDTTKRLKKSG